MSRIGSRKPGPPMPSEPRNHRGWYQTPDAPNLCGPSPTTHPNRPGNRGMLNDKSDARGADRRGDLPQPASSPATNDEVNRRTA